MLNLVWLKYICLSKKYVIFAYCPVFSISLCTGNLYVIFMRLTHVIVTFCFAQFISLASQVFTGNTDASSLRYVLLVSDFVRATNLTQPTDFSKFATAIYPFLNVCSLCFYWFIVFSDWRFIQVAVIVLLFESACTCLKSFN